MGIRIWLLLVSVAVLLSPACEKHPDPGAVPGAAGPAHRVVSTTPSATAILEELGALDTLVGRDKFSVNPESIQALPVVGDFATPNVEAIVALHPDLVLLDASQENARRSLDALGVRNLVLTMHRLSDVRTGIREIGQALGKTPVADKLNATLQSAIGDITERAAQRKRQPKVLLIIDRAPDSLRNLVAAGPGSYLDELLTLVGGINAMAGATVLYPQLGAEQILRAAPDIIVDVSHAQGSIDAYDLVSEVPAVRNHRVYIVDEDSFRSPSPKAARALERLFELTDL